VFSLVRVNRWWRMIINNSNVARHQAVLFVDYEKKTIGTELSWFTHWLVYSVSDRFFYSHDNNHATMLSHVFYRTYRMNIVSTRMKLMQQSWIVHQVLNYLHCLQSTILRTIIKWDIASVDVCVCACVCVHVYLFAWHRHVVLFNFIENISICFSSVNRTTK
jgi:hypothetical protein